ncbi:MAG: flagellar assembly protein FliW [Proteobacteria bacterium]|nr:flagellar assembly protein FliW [Pseudomonadota bacterium]
MNIDSPRFGTLKVEPGKIIEFPAGLAGFEDCRRFSLFHPDEGDVKYFILQSLDDPALAFHIADPAQLGFNFEIALSDAETALLKLNDPLDAAVAVILLKDEGDSPVRANLKAPLIINTRERLGLQHIVAQ